VDKIKAVLFDLHGTLAFVKDPVSDVELSEYLFCRGYDVSPQQLRAAWFFVSMVDYPKYGYKNWRSYFSRILWRLNVKVDKETLDIIVKLLERSPYQLYPDAAEAVIMAKQNGFKTAIVTTIADFQFKKAIEPIEKFLDFVITGYKVKCDKSNPKGYRKVLEILKVETNEAIMIGDNVLLDVELPKKLGIKTILLDRKRENIKCPQADFIVNDLKEAIEIIITHKQKQ
jgi:FMN phosphatase YigB (HAD superfamily)